MDLKNAAVVCLISLFSATLVVLIARSLDSQTASQLEPQLTAIADELRAIRKQGGLPSASADAEAAADGLIVYYFHSSERCATCLAIEGGTRETLDSDFAPQLDSETIVHKKLNFEKPSGKKLADRFKVADPVIVLVKMKDNEIADWKRLDKVRALAEDRKAFRTYLGEELRKMLPAEEPPAKKTKELAAPSADKDKPATKKPPAIPVP